MKIELFNTPDTQARDWNFVINNPTISDEELDEYLKKLPHVRYFVFAREKGNGTVENPYGTVHHQGYIEFSIPKRFSTMKKYFSKDKIGVNAHLMQRKYSRESCVLYVKKEGLFSDKSNTRIGKIFEFGEFSKGGDRTDINNMLKELMRLKEQGVSDSELFDKYPNVYARHYKMLDELLRRKKREEAKKNRRNIEVTYIYGQIGIGKTSYVLDKYGDENVYRLTDYGEKGNPLFDDYNGEDVLLLDDYRSEISMRNLLNLLGRFSVPLHARYMNHTANFTKVYILSDVSIENQYTAVYSSRRDEWCAFLRCINRIYNFNESKENIVKEISFTNGTTKNLIFYDEDKKIYLCEYLEESSHPP